MTLVVNLYVDPEDVLEILQRAKTRLLERGWMQGTSGHSQGPNCLRGAIYWETYEVVKDESRGSRAQTLAEGLFMKAAGGYDSPSLLFRDTIWAWNDFDGRTESEVHEVLDEAIRLAKEAL